MTVTIKHIPVCQEHCDIHGADCKDDMEPGVLRKLVDELDVGTNLLRCLRCNEFQIVRHLVILQVPHLPRLLPLHVRRKRELR